MRYSFVTVKVPKHGCFAMQRSKHGEPTRYLYQYLTREQAHKFGLKGKRPARLIGRLVEGTDGKELLSPNENYYELNGIKAPQNAVLEGSGRKPGKAATAKATKETLQEPAKAEGKEVSKAYGFAVKQLFAEAGVTKALEQALGERRAKQVTALAAYLCEGDHQGLYRFKAFCERQFPEECEAIFEGGEAGAGDNDSDDASNDAGEPCLTLNLSEDELKSFYMAWNGHFKSQSTVFYDIASFSTYEEGMQVAKACWDLDEENLVQQNIGLFCDRLSGLPLYVTSYNGSVNDMGNYERALELAQKNGLAREQGNTELVPDGGFSRRNFCWAHLKGHSFVAGVSCDKLKSVRERLLTWADKLSDYDVGRCWRIDGRGHSYVSSRAENFSLGGVTGTLVMYRDLSAWVDQVTHLAERRQERREFLENLAHWPGEDFDAFAKSFEDQFIVVRDDSSPKGFTFKENETVLSESAALCGKTTLFTTNSKLSDKELLKLYLSKDALEERFDVMKNDLSDGRLRVEGEDPVEGKLFCAFAGLILWRLLKNRFGDPLMKRSMLVSDAIAELEDIEIARKSGGKYVIGKTRTEMQKEILVAFGCFKTLKDAFDARVEAENLRRRSKKPKDRSRDVLGHFWLTVEINFY